MSNLVTIKKMNRVLTIDVNNVDMYLKEGYDQIDDKGQVVKAATGGKMVSIGEHNAALLQIKELKEELKAMEEENIRLAKQARGNQNKN
jgi:hypothetical protein